MIKETIMIWQNFYENDDTKPQAELMLCRAEMWQIEETGCIDIKTIIETLDALDFNEIHKAKIDETKIGQWLSDIRSGKLPVDTEYNLFFDAYDDPQSFDLDAVDYSVYLAYRVQVIDTISTKKPKSKLKPAAAPEQMSLFNDNN